MELEEEVLIQFGSCFILYSAADYHIFCLGPRELGKVSSKERPLIDKFSGYSHYSEIVGKDLATYYYYKEHGTEKSFIALRIGKDELEKHSEALRVYEELQTKYSSFLLKYLGEKPDLPIFDNSLSKKMRDRITLLTFDSFDYNMELEMTLRLVRKKPFEESDLWGVIFCSGFILGELQDRKMVHGGIGHKCFVSRANLIKMTLHSIWPFEGDQIAAILEGRKVYTSKEMHDEIKQSKQPKDIRFSRRVKGDVFGLGLVLLEMASLCIPSSYFDLNGNFSKKTVFKMLSKLRSTYSEDLYKVVRELVLLDEGERPDGIELRKLAWLFANKHTVTRVDRTGIDVSLELRKEIYSI